MAGNQNSVINGSVGERNANQAQGKNGPAPITPPRVERKAGGKNGGTFVNAGGANSLSRASSMVGGSQALQNNQSAQQSGTHTTDARTTNKSAAQNNPTLQNGNAPAVVNPPRGSGRPLNDGDSQSVTPPNAAKQSGAAVKTAVTSNTQVGGVKTDIANFVRENGGVPLVARTRDINTPVMPPGHTDKNGSGGRSPIQPPSVLRQSARRQDGNSQIPKSPAVAPVVPPPAGTGRTASTPQIQNTTVTGGSGAAHTVRETASHGATHGSAPNRQGSGNMAGGSASPRGGSAAPTVPAARQHPVQPPQSGAGNAAKAGNGGKTANSHQRAANNNRQIAPVAPPKGSTPQKFQKRGGKRK
jgi:hypothetical protein